jgi:hypothetical protein
MEVLRPVRLMISAFTYLNEDSYVSQCYLRIFDKIKFTMNSCIIGSKMFSKPIQNRYIDSLFFIIGSFGNNIDKFDFDINFGRIGKDTIRGKFIIHKKIEKFFIEENENDISEIFMQFMIVLMLLKLCDRYKLHDSTIFFLEKRDLLLNTFGHHEKYILIKMLSQKFSENIYAKKKRKENLYGL